MLPCLVLEGEVACSHSKPPSVETRAEDASSGGPYGGGSSESSSLASAFAAVLVPEAPLRPVDHYAEMGQSRSNHMRRMRLALGKVHLSLEDRLLAETAKMGKILVEAALSSPALETGSAEEECDPSEEGHYHYNCRSALRAQQRALERRRLMRPSSHASLVAFCRKSCQPSSIFLDAVGVSSLRVYLTLRVTVPGTSYFLGLDRTPLFFNPLHLKRLFAR